MTSGSSSRRPKYAQETSRRQEHVFVLSGYLAQARLAVAGHAAESVPSMRRPAPRLGCLNATDGLIRGTFIYAPALFPVYNAHLNGALRVHLRHFEVFITMPEILYTRAFLAFVFCLTPVVGGNRKRRGLSHYATTAAEVIFYPVYISHSYFEEAFVVLRDEAQGLFSR